MHESKIEELIKELRKHELEAHSVDVHNQGTKGGTH
jgi:hypothetical protein